MKHTLVTFDGTANPSLIHYNDAYIILHFTGESDIIHEVCCLYFKDVLNLLTKRKF
jgi:hypothetical protein